MKTFLALIIGAAVTASAQQQQTKLPEGYWPEEKSNAILAKTEVIRLAPDLSSLSSEEQAALKDLLAAGAIMQKLYEVSRHHEAQPALDQLRVLDVRLGQPKATQNLLDLYRLFQGP
ncbi:MAG TPA: NUDIX hydrolase, partial [Thermoanaerobaculia bacterium]|nr:NUDIX hydrolase [Thermoanaerobaculia bacterium]